MNNPRVYQPYQELKLGVKIWVQMFGELIEFRELIWRLFMRDLSAKYKQSLLGNIWILIMPLVAIGTFVYLGMAGILHIHENQMPYPLYCLIGLSLWQIFSTGLNAGANSLVGSGDLITKTRFPREVLVIASMGQSIFEFIVKTVLIVVFFFIFKFCPSWASFFLPLLILPLLLLTLGFSLILSLLNGIMRDTANIVSLLLMFLMFLTPVMYPISTAHHSLLDYNILTPLINAPRDVIATGHIISLKRYLIASVISLMIFLFCWRLFHLAETKIPERI